MENLALCFGTDGTGSGEGACLPIEQAWTPDRQGRTVLHCLCANPAVAPPFLEIFMKLLLRACRRRGGGYQSERIINQVLFGKDVQGMTPLQVLIRENYEVSLAHIHAFLLLNPAHDSVEEEEEEKDKERTKNLLDLLGSTEQNVLLSAGKRDLVNQLRQMGAQGFDEPWSGTWFDPSLLSSDSNITEQGRAAASRNSYSSVMAGTPANKTTASTWTIKILNRGDGVSLGLATQRTKEHLYAYLGNEAGAWAYRSSGTLYNSRNKKDYGVEYGTGAVVQVVYDPNKRELSFIVDGKDQGVAVRDLPQTDLFLAAGLWERASIQILE
jgi:hypothetical protein